LTAPGSGDATLHQPPWDGALGPAIATGPPIATIGLISPPVRLAQVEAQASPASRRIDSRAKSGGSARPRSCVCSNSHRAIPGSGMLHPTLPAPYTTAPLSTQPSRRPGSEISTSQSASLTTGPSGEPVPLECMDSWTPSVHHRTDTPATPGGGSRPHLCARNKHRARFDSHRVASGRDMPNPAQSDAYPVVETAASELSARSIRMRACTKVLKTGRVSSADPSNRTLGSLTPPCPWHLDTGAQTPLAHRRTDVLATPGGGSQPHLWARNEPRVRSDSPRVASGREVSTPAQPDVYPVVETAASELSVCSIDFRTHSKALMIGKVSSADLLSRALGGQTPLHSQRPKPGVVPHRDRPNGHCNSGGLFKPKSAAPVAALPCLDISARHRPMSMGSPDPAPPLHAGGTVAPAPRLTPPQRTVLSMPESGNAALNQSPCDCVPGPATTTRPPITLCKRTNRLINTSEGLAHAEAGDPPDSRRTALCATSVGSACSCSQVRSDSHRVIPTSTIQHPALPVPYTTVPLSPQSGRTSGSEMSAKKLAGRMIAPSNKPTPLESAHARTPLVHH
jgi:hypothetical protein